MARRDPYADRELPGTSGEGHKVVWRDPDTPYIGPGREYLRVLAHNALSRSERREKARASEMESYLDEMADAVASQADSYLSDGYDSRRAWSLAIRLVIHGREPD